MQCGYDLFGLAEFGRCPECGFGYQHAATAELVRLELDRRRGAVDAVVRYAAFSLALAILVAMGVSSLTFYLRGGLMALLFGYGMLLGLRHGGRDSAVVGRTMVRTFAGAVLLLTSAALPKLVLGIAWIILTLALLAAANDRPIYPYVHASISDDAQKAMRRRRHLAWGLTLLAGIVSLIAAGV